MPIYRSCLLAAIVLLSLLPGLSPAAATLRVLSWPGYADPDLVKTFEARTGSRVEITVINSDESMWQQLHDPGGENFDVFAVNTAELQRYIKDDRVQPLNMAAITNHARQLPRFRDLARIHGLVHADRVYAIPYTYAEMGLIYDRAQFARPPASINVLWDPRFQGKVIAYNGGNHNFTLAAQSMGYTTPFQLSEGDWLTMVLRLIELRRNALGFYTQPQESVDLFIRNKAAVLFANFGSQQYQMLRKAGADVGYSIPLEGAIAWLDCWAVLRGTRNTELAEAWINYMLEEGPSNALRVRQGLANTTQATDDEINADNLRWLEPVENAERRDLLWGRIMSGARASKVLAP